MNPETKDPVASIQGKLLNLARKTGKPYGELLLYYGMERFLYRLSESMHRDEFILKGGLVFRGWGMIFRRPTRDMDLRDFTVNSARNLMSIVQEICVFDVEEDGMTFLNDSVRVEEVQVDADYRGLRVSFTGTLGRSRIPIQIDISFADEIVPRPVEVVYPTLLGMPSPRLFGYPPEAVVAEKLLTMVVLDELNNRMKDFYDLWQITSRLSFDGKVLQRAIRTAFQKRHINLPDALPQALTDDFVTQRRPLWQTFLGKFLPDSEVHQDFGEVIGDLRTFLSPMLESLRKNETFNARWVAGEGWKL